MTREGGGPTEGEGGAEKKCNDRNEDPQLSVRWDKFDDVHVRRVASNKIVKKWELLTMCRDVIDENDGLVGRMTMKECLKENVSWQDQERKHFIDWKAKNIVYMSLKKSKQKEKSGPFDQFCKKKGWGQEKEMWEVSVKNENERKETLMKEITTERKPKARKRKLEVYRKCKEVLLKELTDWKMSPGAEEDEEFETLKEIAKQERKKKELKSETSEYFVTTEVMCKTAEPMKPFKVMRAVDLVCGKPIAPSSATVDGRMKKNVFTKPQQVYSGVAAEASSRPGPARPTNRERVAGNQETGLAEKPIRKERLIWSETNRNHGD